MWIESSTTGSYIFTGIKKTRNMLNYVYDVYDSAIGPTETYYDDVSSLDVQVELTTWFERLSNRNMVGFAVTGRSPTRSYGFTTNINKNLWDVLQTGMSISSGPGDVDEDFDTNNHHWRCGSCGDTWLFQSSNGTDQLMGSPANWEQWWDLPPSFEFGSYGGIYKAFCGLSESCP